MSREQDNLFFQVVARRYERVSMILIKNSLTQDSGGEPTRFLIVV